MTARLLMILMISTLAFAGCAEDEKKGTAGVDKNGNCTFETVNAHNDIAHKSQMFQMTGDAAYQTGLRNACDKFKSLVGGGCRAEDMKTGTVTWVTANTVTSLCN